jgi:hypothetical protein
VLDEIAAINHGDPASSILVDDARMFLGAPLEPHDPAQWPTLLEVTDALRVHDRHVTLIEDVLVAVPPSARAAVDTYWQTTTTTGAPRPSAETKSGWRLVAERVRRIPR